MVIYHAVSFYQLLTCVVHSCQMESERKIIFLGNNVKTALHSPMYLENIFDEVVYIDINAGLSDVTMCKTAVTTYFQEILEKNNITIEQDTDIYVGGTQFNFGLYLATNDIPFYFMEEACGLLSNTEHIKNIDKDRSVFSVVDESGLYDATCASIKGIVCNVLQQDEEIERDNLIHFDTLQVLFSLDNELKHTILSIFTDIKEIDISENTVVVLSQHYANLNMMSYERQVLLYGLLFDYYLKGKNVLIKKHPYDFVPYEIIYPKVRRLEERFPSEFLPIISNKELEMVATISSTGIKSLKSVVNNYMEFDYDFEQHFEPIHKVYFALQMLFAQEKVDKIYTIGVNKFMIENMCKHTLDVCDTQVLAVSNVDEIEENAIVFVDRIKGSCLEDWDIERIAEYFSEECPAKQIFFMNSERDYVFHRAKNETVWNNVVPIVLEKDNKNINRDFELYNDFGNETFYLYTKNKEIRHMAVEFKNSRELENLEIEVRTNGFDSKEQMRISVLEGILDATEQRLNHYIRKCNELENELNSLRK